MMNSEILCTPLREEGDEKGIDNEKGCFLPLNYR